MKMKPYLEYTDKLVDQIFSRQLMQLLNVHSIDLSNHLAALIASKVLTSELEGIQKNLKAYKDDQENRDKAEDFYLSRMLKVEELAEKARNTLYNFNKNRMREFMSNKENLIIMEHFLALSNELHF